MWSALHRKSEARWLEHLLPCVLYRRDATALNRNTMDTRNIETNWRERAFIDKPEVFGDVLVELRVFFCCFLYVILHVVEVDI